MNKHIKSLLACAAAALTLAGCEMNDFNENYLEGFDPDTTITDIKTLALELTDDDYSAIASNSTNKSLATTLGGDASSALAAIGTNKYFSSSEDAQRYIPAWIAANYSTADDGSSANVTYALANGMPENVAAMNAMKAYTLTTDDYKTVWGSETDYVEAITPATASKLASVISAEELEAGDYVAVTYKYSATEPTFGSTEDPGTEDPGTDPTPSKPELTSTISAATLGATIEATGYVSAISTQGPIITDKSGSILLYDKGATSFAIGEVVAVSGTVDQYNNGFQLTAAATVEKTGATVSATYPAATELTGALMDELIVSYLDSYHLAEFVKVTGTLSISGNYYNLNVDGAETAVGSLYNPSTEVKEKLSNGQTVTIYGYFMAVSKQSGAGKFVNIIVTHVDEEPAFGGDEPSEPAGPELTSTIGAATLGAALEATGYVSAISTQGPIITDKSGSILLYDKGATSFAIGEVVAVSGTVDQYNNGFQLTAAATVEKTGATVSATYPAATELTGALMDELIVSFLEDYHLAQFVKVTGTLSISGNYYNLNVDGAETAVGSLYNPSSEVKEKLSNGQTVTIYGYFMAVSKQSGAGKFVNIIVTHVNEAPATAYAGVLTRAAAVTTVNQYGIYNFDGSKFTDAGNVIVQPADFTAMGNTYGSFTNPDQDTYLPKFLAANYPYAKEGDTKYVSFRCYNSGTTSWKTDEYVFDSSAWVKNDYIEATSDKFERTNKTWTWNPSVTLYFQPVRNEATAMAFFQAVTDWVWANIDQPMGITSKGGGFVTSYGNNEYYTGCSAYYNNVDLRAASARAQYSGESYQGNDLVAAGVAFSGDAYDSLSDNEVQELMIKRLQYVVGKTLEELYPDMRTIDGIEIFYTVHVPLYRGTTVNECNAYLKYKVTGPAQLEFVEMVEY